MRILYHHRIASKDGQFVHVEEIISALRNAGHDVNVVAPAIAEKSEFGHDGGWVAKLKANLPKWCYEVLELTYSLWLMIKLSRAIVKHKPDAIYERYNLYQPAGVIISKIFKLPLILEVNAPLFEERTRYSGQLGMPKLARAIEHFTWKNATVVLPVSNVLKDIISTQTQRKENVFAVHNGIRKSLLETMLPAKWSPGEPITIGFVGFMHLTCGVEHLLTLMKENPNLPLRLVCIGDGPRASALKEMADKLSLNDKTLFTGLISREKIFEYISTFHIAIQPAVTAYASPLKMFEYMAAESLIVAPDQANIKEILSHRCALFFDPCEPDSFKESVKHAVTNFSQLQELRTGARQQLIDQGFTWESNVEKIISHIERVK